MDETPIFASVERDLGITYDDIASHGSAEPTAEPSEPAPDPEPKPEVGPAG
jgi:hypothetical protein